MIERIKLYLDETIVTKRTQSKTIRDLRNQIDKILSTLEESRKNEQYALDKLNKMKKKYNEENKKHCIYEIQKEKEINELEKEIKKIKKELKKKENQNENK